MVRLYSTIVYSVCFYPGQTSKKFLYILTNKNGRGKTQGVYCPVSLCKHEKQTWRWRCFVFVSLRCGTGRHVIEDFISCFQPTCLVLGVWKMLQLMPRCCRSLLCSARYPLRHSLLVSSVCSSFGH